MNQEKLENVIGRMDEVRGLLEMQGKAAALPRLERHIQDLRELATALPRRPLSSLTEVEINACYKQAMGVDYDVERVDRSDTNSSITAYVGKDYLSLDEIDGHLRVSATIFFDGWEYPAMMRMAPLVRYLDGLGIQPGV